MGSPEAAHMLRFSRSMISKLSVCCLLDHPVSFIKQHDVCAQRGCVGALYLATSRTRALVGASKTVQIRAPHRAEDRTLLPPSPPAGRPWPGGTAAATDAAWVSNSSTSTGAEAYGGCHLGACAGCARLRACRRSALTPMAWRVGVTHQPAAPDPDPRGSIRSGVGRGRAQLAWQEDI